MRLDQSRQDRPAACVDPAHVGRELRGACGRPRVGDLAVLHHHGRVRDDRPARPIHEPAISDQRHPLSGLHGGSLLIPVVDDAADPP